jgi:hypothetical protein
MNHSSERQSPLGSRAFSRHCSSRWVLVNDPSFSTWEAAGSRNTSVAMSSVRSSPDSISGASRQKLADSISTRSRTTSQSSLAMARRCSRELADPTAGFSPSRKNPRTLPSSMSMAVR